MGTEIAWEIIYKLVKYHDVMKLCQGMQPIYVVDGLIFYGVCFHLLS